MIVTLAGHVDHGKTSLVRAITGIETDRLLEERQRGLTIDLGFAYATNNATGDVLGFVDVPGHHRFIHNMVAGVAALQYALLAIAADDGPMPQSREHLQILELTGVGHGIIALTKCDRVSADRIRAAEHEIRGLVAGTFLEHARIVHTSAQSGLGINVLTDALWAAQQNQGQQIATGQFRLAVDRAFSIKGSGLVVTGTVHSGEVSRSQELRVFPSGETVRVRNLRAQDRPVDRATAGDRTALNLTGIDLQRVGRGCWLTEAANARHRNFAVAMRVVGDFPRTVRHWLPVHVYHATTHSTAHLALLDAKRLQPGQQGDVELVTDEPLCARHGDHIVVRDQGLDRTLGGGLVMTDLPPMARRRTPERLARVAAFKRGATPEIVQALLDVGPVEIAPLQNTLGLTDKQLRELVNSLDVLRRGDAIISGSHWQSWRATVLAFMARHQSENPESTGARPNHIPAAVPDQFRTELLNELVAEQALGRTAGTYHLPKHVATLPAAEQALLQRVRGRLDVDQAPSVGDLAKQLGIPIAKLDTGLKSLARRGLLAQVSAKRFYWPERLSRVAAYATELSNRAPFTVRDFRDATGIGRNVAIEVLEYFDGRGFTRRIGDTRLVVKDYD